MADIEVRQLDNDSLWKRSVDMSYTSNSYFDLCVETRDSGWSFTFEERTFEEPLVHEEEYPLMRDYKGETEVWAAYVGGREAGLLQIGMDWNRGLRVWDICVNPEFHRRGVGTALMNRCKERAGALGARRIIIETQSCNANAIRFYLSQGFSLGGFDNSCYGNDDVERKEVRLEMIMLLA